MGAFLFVAIIFFGRWTIPLLINLIVLVIELIGSLFTASKAAESESEAKPVQVKAAAVPEETPKRENKELPQEQKVMFCSAIIEDSFSYRDDFLDELYEGTEHPIFSVPECLSCSEKQYEDQFGKKWTNAWIDALSMAFDVRFEYLGSGCFVADNIQ